MRIKRGFAITLSVAVLLALGALAAACGGDDDNDGTPTASPIASVATDVQIVIDEVAAMVSAAEGDDLAAAQAAFDAAHDPLHAVIDGLETTNPGLATELDEAVDDAESDLEAGEEAEHVVEIGNEILRLLSEAAAE